MAFTAPRIRCNRAAKGPPSSCTGGGPIEDEAVVEAEGGEYGNASPRVSGNGSVRGVVTLSFWLFAEGTEYGEVEDGVVKRTGSLSLIEVEVEGVE